MSFLTFQEQEAVEDYIQYSGPIVNWDTRTGFTTLLNYLERMGIGVRIEDHQPQWKAFLQDSGGALLGIGTGFDDQPYRALALAVVQAGINDPVGKHSHSYRHNGYN
jgi:hypothetical protein